MHNGRKTNEPHFVTQLSGMLLSILAFCITVLFFVAVGVLGVLIKTILKAA